MIRFACIMLCIFLGAIPLSFAREDTLFETRWGTGPSDNVKYSFYQSAIFFSPDRTMEVAAIKPMMHECKGECIYDVIVADKDGTEITKLLQRGQKLKVFDGRLESPLLLEAGKTYRITMKVDSTKEEVGVYTAGGAPFPNRKGPARLELISAGRGMQPFTERGPIAFSLVGRFIGKASLAEKAIERGAKRLQEKAGAKKVRPEIRRNIRLWPG